MKYAKNIFYQSYLVASLVSLFSFGIFGSLDRQTASAQAAPGIIAYVSPSTNDIHLISPDGTGDRVLWTAPETDGVWPAYDLAWRPDGSELAFSSNHEETCSVYQSDIYAISYNGTGYRRVTNSPACAVLASLPKGSVEVDISNYMGPVSKAYVQGAPGIQPVPDGYSRVTFNDVADLGPGVLQPPVGLYGIYRFMPSGPLPDVQPGETVYGGNLIIFSRYSGVDAYGAGKISWKSDGSTLGYGMRTYFSIRQLPANPPYGSEGVDLPVVEATEPGLVAWGPTDATKDQYLYYSQPDLLAPPEIEGIYLNTVGDTSGGTKLVSLDNWTGPHVYDIEWLPDGSGFLFSQNYVNFEIYTDIFEYNFATQEITQLTPSLPDQSGDGGARGFSISPDGQQIVFERAVYPLDTSNSLWIMNRDGSDLHKLADDAGRPAWGQTPSFPAPTITGLNPSSAIAGGSAFALTVNGTGFMSGSVVRWNGSDRATTYVNNTQVTASIPAADIAAAGSASVTVFNPAPGGGTSNAASISINNPAPAITGLNPSSATAVGSGFSLTVDGTGFVNGAIVRWNGSDRATTYVNDTRLTASIPAADIATAGSASVTVFNPAPGGGGSNTAAFQINNANPAPAITGLNPPSATAGGSAFTLTVDGTGFVSGSVVRWNGSDRATTYINGTQLTASIPAADIATAGSASVTVFNPAPGGGTSNTAAFQINNANPAPAITSLNPSSATAGGSGFTLTINGTGFVNGAIVRWNGSDRATTYVNDTRLTASIPAADIATAGSASVTVFNPAPGGGGSNTAAFQINTINNANPVPAITGLNPPSATAGGSAFTLTVDGTGFVSGSVIRWNGSDRATTYVNDTRLTASIPATDIAASGSASVTVFNPAPGGGTSNAVSFSINNPAPTITGLNPSGAEIGGSAFSLTVNGTGFVNGSVVRWNGSDRATAYVNHTKLTASIPAADIATTGSASVTVFNPTPGGGTSNTMAFGAGNYHYIYLPAILR